MNSWQWRTLGVLGIGGGCVGVVAIFMTAISNLEFASWLILAPFCLLYMYAIYAGILALERSKLALKANIWLWALQVPIFKSSTVSYLFTCGFFAAISASKVPPNLNFNWQLGSQFNFTINQPNPLLVGINIFAVGILAFLLNEKRRTAP
ncbi:hypothetical protein [Solilutibacter oculi]|uniref:hypothetical protein n=1 Tax=Solilutibacter oculi TaxID=2698682 RepID=UPI0013A5FEDA|nr:hypothetical protein [Lysobacter oculi]